MDDISRMKELIDILNKASRAYYSDDEEIMSNVQYDALYDELLSLESKTGTVIADSPTQKVGYEVQSALPKVKHQSPMLSLDKTKDPAALKAWLKDKEGDLSWKMDGITVVLTYENGELVQAATRGNGETGEIITANARTFKNLPSKIPFNGQLTIRGEAVISYDDFEKINGSIPEGEQKYKNPRNLCSGSVRQLNSRITAERNVNLIAFSLVEAQGIDDINSRWKRLEFLRDLGFETVYTKQVTAADVEDAVRWFSENIKNNKYPSDGLVLTLDDRAYSLTLGTTAKFPRDSIAFKWQDETAETKLLDIEWNASRTGLINPVAVFEAVELEGTTVSRASVHNLSLVEELKLGVGDIIEVYKANMIIPQIKKNMTGSGTVVVPESCPACGEATEIHNEKGTKTLVCVNPLCPAKRIRSFEHFVERNCMNIEGLSVQTLEKLVDMGFIKEFADIFSISAHKDRIEKMEGFGEKSFNNLIESIERSRNVEPGNLLNSLGIPNVGLSNAKLVADHFDNDVESVINACEEDLTGIEGIGPVIGRNIYDYFHSENTLSAFRRLIKELNIIKPVKSTTSSPISGKTFVITGSLNTFQNRDELKRYIEDRGGKVTGSVTSKTDFLINNDVTSGSGKNKKAKELGVPVIDEDSFREMAEGI